MLEIRKDDMVLKVSNGSFKSMYGPSGWVVADAPPVEPSQKPPVAPMGAVGNIPPSDWDTSPGNTQGAPTSDSDEDTLFKMNVDELRQYASLLGIKVKDLKTRNKLIEAIKSHKE